MQEIRDLEQPQHQALKASHRFLEIANRYTTMSTLLTEFLAEIKSLTGCEAVGIRILDDNGEIPYEAYDGFSQEFYKLENRLSILRDQCMCINIVTGATDPKSPFFTIGASFYINHLSQFFSTLSPEERAQLRGRCHEFGYESMALVPIPLGGSILGMIHVADPRKDLMPRTMVELLEAAGMQLGTAIQRVKAEEALKRAHDELERRVEERAAELKQTVEQLLCEIDERQQAEKSLRESEKKLRTLTSQLLTVQEGERKRLSRELHDSLGQTLLVLKLQLRAIEERLRPDQQTLRQESKQTLRQIDRIIEDVRRLARNLSPSVLEDLGLAVALRNLCEEFGRHQSLNLSLDMADILGSFSPEAQSHIYRIFQESLTNIGKYAQASRVSLVIKRRDGGVAFVIKDNGIGFQLEEVQTRDGAERAMGLATMAERVRMLGGELDITSKRGGGTRISFIVPEASVS
jgi:signal transduction histidine kinase